MTSRKCPKKKRAQQVTEANRSSRFERSQALLDKSSEHEFGFIFCEKKRYNFGVKKLRKK